MSKVIFEFDEDEDRIEIENIIKREYRRKLSKGYINNEIIVKDRKVIAEGTEVLTLEGDIIGRKSYIPVSDVIDELDDCLKRVVQLLD